MVGDAAERVVEAGNVVVGRSLGVRVERSQEQIDSNIDEHVRRVCESADALRDCMESYSTQEMHPHDIKMLGVAGRKAMRQIHVAIRTAKSFHGEATAEQRIAGETKDAVDQAEKALADFQGRPAAPADSTAGTTSAGAATVMQPVCQNDTDASAAHASGQHAGAGTGGAGTSRSATDAAEPGFEGPGEHEVTPTHAQLQGAPAQGAPSQGSPAQGAPARGAHWRLVTSAYMLAPVVCDPDNMWLISVSNLT